MVKIMTLAPQSLMLMISVSIFFAIKWRMSLTTRSRLSSWSMLQWFTLTPTLDPKAFFATTSVKGRPSLATLRSGLTGMAIGSSLIWWIAPWAAAHSEMLAGWLAVAGLILLMHFGLLHLIVAAWQSCGRTSQPLMLSPWLAESPSDFWGRRWNTAFRDVAHQLILLPLTRRWGSRIASVLCFLFSGLVHELAISVPAHGGYGGPTAYFMLQWFGLFMERWIRGHIADSRLRRVLFRLIAIVIVLVPAPLLFHRAFLVRVILPLVGISVDDDSFE
ncbi:MAG: hypothetical protein JNL58_29390 [Planctomyces sp.]|nr:hypothetical protein [Planctomyces sp.]